MNEKVGILLPSHRRILHETMLVQQLQSVQHFFSEYKQLELLAFEEDVDLYAKMFYETSVRNAAELSQYCDQYDELIVLINEVYRIGNTDSVESLQELDKDEFDWLFDVYGRRFPLKGQTDYMAEFMRAHVFNELSPEGNVNRYFFPYGYLGRDASMGATDAFGFRIARDFRDLKKRAPNHKLILCYGGSSTFSPFCLPDQMFTAILEKRLNQHCSGEGMDLTFTVLNFAQQASLVLNETFAHLLWGEPLQPDIVIAHDGFNDLCIGPHNDPFLVGEHQICYGTFFEEWARRLQDSENRKLSERSAPTAQQVLNAYLTRKTQFRRLVEQGGTQFYSGLQPVWCERARVHPVERALVGQGAQAVMNVVLYMDAIPNISTNEFNLDFHQGFKNCGDDTILFGDIVHMLPAGDAIIGNQYADLIISDFLKAGKPLSGSNSTDKIS